MGKNTTDEYNEIRELNEAILQMHVYEAEVILVEE